MDHETYLALRNQLTTEYVLIKKSKFWYLLGGVLAFLMAAGIVSFAAARSALESQPAQLILDDMKEDAEEAKSILSELQSKARRFSEIQLGNAGAWKEILRLDPQTAIRIEAYTSENNYVQPFTAYAWRAYESQDAAIKFSPAHPQLHAHSNSVEWQMLGNGTLRVRKTTYDTGRTVGITSIQVMRGQYEILAEELER